MQHTFLDSIRSLKFLSPTFPKFELLTHHFLYQLSNFQLPFSTFLSFSLSNFSSQIREAFEYFSILFPIHLLSSNGQPLKNHESAALILDYSWSRGAVHRADEVGMGNRSGPHARYCIPLDVRMRLHVPG